jgi:hypothetical protein
MAFKIELGSKVRDRITGFTGIVTARTEWIFGCIRYSVQPEKLNKDGTIVPSEAFDESSLVVVGKMTGYKPVATGGPKPAPSRQKDPTR